MNVGPSSKSVTIEYERLINKFGSELSILQDVPVDTLSKDSPLLGEGISRLRAGKVIKHAGYDGEYGVIRLFDESELVKKNFINLKLDIDLPENTPQQPQKKSINKTAPATLPRSIDNTKTNKKYGLDQYQKSAVENSNNQLLIVARPRFRQNNGSYTKDCLFN